MKRVVLNKILLSICLLFSLNCLSAQVKRAVVIGIGDYPEESGWSKIHGDKDVALTKEYLSNLGFKSSDIVELTDEKATKQNIVSAIDNLAKVSKKGDCIYIHFSGHGQRITDLDGDEGAAGFDESLIAYDARKSYMAGVYEGESHLVDDELNLYLNRIAAAIGDTGKLCVVIDACHSGGATREEDDDEIFTRGGSDKFIIPQSKVSRSNSRQNEMSWVEISACKSYQTNFECKVGDSHFGVLTYSIYKMLAELEGKELVVNANGNSIANTIADMQSAQGVFQTPVVTMPEGVAEFYFL